MRRGLCFRDAGAVDGTPPRGEFTGIVRANQALCREHYRLTLEVVGFPPSTPGQFIEILSLPGGGSTEKRRPTPASSAGPGDETARPREWQWTAAAPPRFTDPDLIAQRPYLRRPFSIAQRRDARGQQSDSAAVTQLDIMYRVVGKTTRVLEQLRPGAMVSLLGPLGRGFIIPPSLRLALLVGGGVGIPPMLYLAEQLALRGIPAVAFAGAQRADLFPLILPPGAPRPLDRPVASRSVLEFARHGISSIVATDDGSLGMHGFVTVALRAYLEREKEINGDSTTVFCCGPMPMMKATAAIAAMRKLPCQVSLEQPMACGMGTCQSCVIKYQPAGEPEWGYRLACADGPVFQAADIIWP
jgi:dihydroorotate dehydrogenase electron transfer subunit